jgi:L-malate glycosyltransferase
MRILLVDTAATWRGGQNQALLTARGALARGHGVLLACRRGGALAERARAVGVPVAELPLRGDVSPGALLPLRRLAGKDVPDAMLLNDSHAVLPGLFAAASRATRSVAVRRVDFPLRGPFSRRKYAACHRVIAVSRGIGAVLARGGLPAARVRLVYEGVPDRPAQAGGREALAALGVPASAPLVGNVAALTDHKDHRTLIEAAALVVRALPEARFVIIGDGELRADLEALAKARGLSARVLFLGFSSDLDRLLPAFDVFCLSSHLEGLGTSLLDAMAFARPVVATRAGGIPEAVEDGVTGRVVPVRDPAALAEGLLAVLRDAELRARLGAAGRQRYLERFTDARMVDETLAILGEGR